MIHSGLGEAVNIRCQCLLFAVRFIQKKVINQKFPSGGMFFVFYVCHTDYEGLEFGDEQSSKTSTNFHSLHRAKGDGIQTKAMVCGVLFKVI